MIKLTLKFKLAVIGLSMGIIIPVMAYELASYPSTPFNASWTQDLGKPVFPNWMGSIVENGTFFYLGSYDQNFSPYHEKVPLVIDAINVADGHYSWIDNFTVINPGFSFYGTSGGIVNTMPHIYWHHGKLLLISYVLGYGAGNQVSKFRNISLLILDFNPGNGEIIGSHVFNSTQLSPTAPFVVNGDSVIGYSFQQQGLIYYRNGVQTSTFLACVYALNLTTWKYWNQTFYIQGGPSFSILTAKATGNTLAILGYGIMHGNGYPGNTTFMGFNISSGQHTWNYTSQGNIEGFWATGNEFYFLNSSEGNFNLESIYSSTGKFSGSFGVAGKNISLVQGVILSLNNGVYSAISTQGKIMWTLGHSFSVPISSTSSIFGITNGYAVISVIGSHYHYFVVNLTSGKIAWNRIYYPLASLYGQGGIPADPIAFGDGFAIFSMASPKGNLSILAVNVVHLGLS